MEVKSLTKFVRISPRKLRLIADLVRGQNVNAAMTRLKFERQRGAKVVYKSLMSAVANAEQKGTVDVDNLYVKKIYVDGGPTMKRFMPRAQGRATPIIKRSSHLNIVLGEK